MTTVTSTTSSAASTAQTTQEGDRVWAVRSIPGKWGYVAPAVLRAVRTAAGHLVWRFESAPMGTFNFWGRSRAVGVRSERKAREAGAATGLLELRGARHGKRCP